MKAKTILGATLLLLAIAIPALAAAAPAALPSPGEDDSLLVLEAGAEQDSVATESARGSEWGFRAKLRQRVRVLRILINVAFSLIESRIGGSEQAGWGG